MVRARWLSLKCWTHVGQDVYVGLPLPWSLSSARSRIGARHDGLPRQFSQPLHSCQLCAMAWVSAKDLPVHSAMLLVYTSSSACHFFDCLRMFPEVSPWLGRLILSRVHTISVFATLQLPGYLRTAIIMLYDGFPRMPVSNSVFVWDAKDLWCILACI